jgi:hypothetical protein
MTMTTPMTGEAPNLNVAIKFTEAMGAEIARTGAQLETFAGSLAAGGVSGEPLRLTSTLMELYGQLSGLWGALAAELTTHQGVVESYATVGTDAGEREFEQLT